MSQCYFFCSYFTMANNTSGRLRQQCGAVCGVACGGMLTIRRSTWIQTRHGQSIFASTQQPTLPASGYYNSWPLLFMILRRREVSKPSSLSGLTADTTAAPVNESFSIHFKMVLEWHLNQDFFLLNMQPATPLHYEHGRDTCETHVGKKNTKLSDETVLR